MKRGVEKTEIRKGKGKGEKSYEREKQKGVVEVSNDFDTFSLRKRKQKPAREYPSFFAVSFLNFIFVLGSVPRPLKVIYFFFWGVFLDGV